MSFVEKRLIWRITATTILPVFQAISFRPLTEEYYKWIFEPFDEEHEGSFFELSTDDLYSIHETQYVALFVCI